MVPVSIPPRPMEPGHHHQRAVQPDHPHHVLQHGLPVPAPVGFLHRLGVAVIHGRGEVEVVQTVVAARQDQLARADQPEAVEEFGADRIGARLTAVQAQQGRARPPTAAREREHARVFVVGMGGHMEQARRRVQLEDPLPSSHRAPVRIEPLLSHRRRKRQHPIEPGRAVGRLGHEPDRASQGQKAKTDRRRAPRDVPISHHSARR